MNGQPHNTFQAIQKSSQEKTPEFEATEGERLIIMELRRLLNIGKHHQMMIAYKDGKYLVYHINLHTSFMGDK